MTLPWTRSMCGQHTHTFIGLHKCPQTHLRRFRINSEHGQMHTSDTFRFILPSVLYRLVSCLYFLQRHTHPHTHTHTHKVITCTDSTDSVHQLCVCHIMRKISINLSKRHVPLSLFSLAASEPPCKHTCHTHGTITMENMTVDIQLFLENWSEQKKGRFSEDVNVINRNVRRELLRRRCQEQLRKPGQGKCVSVCVCVWRKCVAAKQGTQPSYWCSVSSSRGLWLLGSSQVWMWVWSKEKWSILFLNGDWEVHLFWGSPRLSRPRFHLNDLPFRFYKCSFKLS